MMELGLGPWEQDEHAKLLCDDWKNVDLFNLSHYLKHFQKQNCSNFETDTAQNENFVLDLTQQDGSISSTSSKTHEEKKTSNRHQKSHKNSESKLVNRKSLPALNNSNGATTDTNLTTKKSGIHHSHSMQVLKPTEIRTDQFHSFEHIENSINSQIMKLKLEKKNYSNNSTTLEQLRPVVSLKSSNVTLYYDTQPSSNTTDSNKSGHHSPTPIQPPAPPLPPQISFSNQTIKLDDLNIYYDYRLSSSDNAILSSANPSTVYRLQKILNIPKENAKSTTTKYRLSKNIPQKQETYYKPASSYTGTTSPSQLPTPAPPSHHALSYPTTLAQEIIESAQPKLNARILRSLANSSSSEENDPDSDEPEANGSDEKIIQIEKIRNKLKEEYNNLLLNSTNIAVRPKSATVCCTPNIQYLKSTINKHSDLDTNIQDELRIIPLNKVLLSRPNSAATTKSKLSYTRSINHINSNNTPKSRSKPHYIDCESDDLAYELDRSLGQFKYESSSSNLMINSTQLPVSRNNRESKQSFYNTNNLAIGNEEKRVYVTNPIRQVLNSTSNNSKIQLENLVSYAMNKQNNQICINGKSMSNSSGIEFTPNYETQNSRVNIERKQSKNLASSLNAESEIKKIQIKFNQLTKIGVK